MKVVWLALSLAHLACASGESVTRRRGDTEQVDRKISAVAYAWYVRGAHHERRGDLEQAARAFRAVVEEDPKSGSAWASLGRVLCRQGDRQALRVLDAGLRKAERKAPILLERARCELVTLTKNSEPPYTEPPSTNRVKIAALCRRAEEALRLEPSSLSVTNFLVHCWTMADDREKASRFDRAGKLYLGHGHQEESGPSLAAVDRALWENNLDLAREFALTDLAPGALAARAALWGKLDLARTQAQLVLGAAPHDGDARVTLIALGDPVPAPSARETPLSVLGVLVFTAHLRRSIGDKAAAQFAGEHRELLEKSNDPLVTELFTNAPASD